MKKLGRDLPGDDTYGLKLSCMTWICNRLKQFEPFIKEGHIRIISAKFGINPVNSLGGDDIKVNS